MKMLKTRWSEKVESVPFNEYPRPQFERDSFFNLNGKWDYAINDGELPERYDGEILVPFSPESYLSGVERTLSPDKTLWYRRTFALPDGFNKGRVIINFGAVDQICEVFINGVKVGENDGGYYPFSFDVTENIKPENEIIVKVVDLTDTSYRETGKQRFARGGIWYTPQSGIWQTVWIESVPEKYVKSVKMTPSYENGEVELEFDKNCEGIVKVKAYFDGKEVACGEDNCKITLKIEDKKSWSPEEPNLYDLEIEYGDDKIKSYFALRDVCVQTASDGKKRIFLNGKPYFMHGLLDQGYWSDGLYTPPCEEAFVYDIKVAKDLGFNMLRKHIKIEPMRWYYLCDKMGMLVWQDMISGGRQPYSTLFTVYNQFCYTCHKDGKFNYRLFGRESEEGRNYYYKNLHRMIDHLYNVPSIVLWTPFNEGWGQFDAKKTLEIVKKADGTRLIDHASGWHDQGVGDFKSTHIYFRPVRMHMDKRAYILTEFGGYTLMLPEHSVNPDEVFGYKTMGSVEQLNGEVKTLFERDVVNNIKKGMCSSVYTQVSDVEDETNGVMTYDREIIKLDEGIMTEIARKIKGEYEKL